jgi:hypothetical protein
LSYGQIGRHKILLLVNIRDVTPISLFTNHRDTVRILGPDPFRLRLAFFWPL